MKKTVPPSIYTRKINEIPRYCKDEDEARKFVECSNFVRMLVDATFDEVQKNKELMIRHWIRQRILEVMRNEYTV